MYLIVDQICRFQLPSRKVSRHLLINQGVGCTEQWDDMLSVTLARGRNLLAPIGSKCQSSPATTQAIIPSGKMPLGSFTHLSQPDLYTCTQPWHWEAREWCWADPTAFRDGSTWISFPLGVGMSSRELHQKWGGETKSPVCFNFHTLRRTRPSDSTQCYCPTSPHFPHSPSCPSAFLQTSIRTALRSALKVRKSPGLATSWV